MATYSKSKVALVVTLGLMPVVLIALFVVNTFVYPFRSATPNFADVEAVYSKLQIPRDWQVIEESENRGIAGRQCPVESKSMCFHKAAVYSVSATTTKDSVDVAVKTSGCVSTVEKDNWQKNDTTGSYTFECMSGALRVFGTWENKDGVYTVRLSVRSR